jgi:hypothetical protein
MTPHSSEILDGLRPRMRKARVAHVRRMMAGLAMVPLIGFGAVAVAADTAADPALNVADSAELDSPVAPEVDLPDIGDGDSAENDTSANSDESPVEETPVDETLVLSLGPLGNAEVVETDGVFELLNTDLVEGWEVHSVEVTDYGIVIVIKTGDSVKVVTVTDGVRDEVDVVVTDLMFPTTTTAPPTTTMVKKHEPEAPSTVVDRFEVVVPERGRFIVERDGDKLHVGDVNANDGYEFHIEKAEGWKVYVKFTNGDWVWYGKALINDNGEVEQHFWDEEPPFEPIFQWVEIADVGAVKFKLWSDGKVYVKEWQPAEGFGFYDYKGGEPADVAKVDFEGEGVLWIVEAWGNEEGELIWSTTDASPAE